jgi:hypothetical protein
MIVRSADMAPRIALVTTGTDTWLLFQRGILPDDVEEELDIILSDVELAETGD